MSSLMLLGDVVHEDVLDLEDLIKDRFIKFLALY